MADTYQAIYDAVRSRINGANVAEAIKDAIGNSFDISWAVSVVQQHCTEAADKIADAGREMLRPSVIFRPKLSADGTAWMALLGDNLQEGVAGFGATPAEAMVAFDLAFLNEKTPAAARTHLFVQGVPTSARPAASV